MFKGKSICLRQMEKGDLVELNRIRNEEDVLINLSMWLPYPSSDAAEEHHFDEKLKKKHSDSIQFVIQKHDGTLIGKCGTMDTDWKNSTTTVWIFIGGEEHRGMGYGSEAMELLISYIFNEMNMNKVRLFAFMTNERAIKSYEKVGFRHEGVLRQELFRKGKYNDVVQMSILRSEFEEQTRGE